MLFAQEGQIVSQRVEPRMQGDVLRQRPAAVGNRVRAVDTTLCQTVQMRSQVLGIAVTAKVVATYGLQRY